MSESRLVGHSSDIRTLDERDLAAMRPAKENTRRPRKPSVLREVTSGIVCFCGERFGEHQALEFMLHLRAEVGETLSWVERKRRLMREQSRARRATEEGRARQNEYRRNYMLSLKANYPERFEAKAVALRERRATPEYRSRLNAAARARYREQPESVRLKNREEQARKKVLHQTGDHAQCYPSQCRLKREAMAP